MNSLGTNISEIELIKQLNKGDHNSFEKLFRLYYKFLISYALKFVSDVKIAEDIIQDIFIKVWENRIQINPKKSFKSYLFSSVHNRCIDHLRKLQNKEKYTLYSRIRIEESSLYQRFHQQSGFQELVFQDLENEIRKSIDLLPDQCMKVFKLSRISGLKNKEIADNLKISIKTVEKHISKALSFMVQSLKDYLA